LNYNAHRFRTGWTLIVIAVIASIASLLLRWSYENSQTGAQLTVDYDDTRTLADAYQIPHAKFLADLKARGVTSVALYDLSLAGFRDNGRVALTPREEAQRLYSNVRWSNYVPAYRYFITATRENQPLLPMILERLTQQGQKALPPRRVAIGDGTFGILIPASRQMISDSNVGFDPAQVTFVKKAGLGVTARLSNSINLNPERVKQMLNDAAAIGARVVIFSEDEVVGYDSLIKTVAKELQLRGLIFGNIEFTKQRGWQDFAKLTEGKLVRVHSVGGEEAAKAKVELLVDRFSRAIKERDIRVAYIRLPRQLKGKYDEENPKDPEKNKSPLQQNLDFVEEVHKDLTAQRVPAFLRPAMQMSSAQAFGNYPTSYLNERFGLSIKSAQLIRYALALFASLGVVGGTLLLLNLFFDLNPTANRTLTIIGLVLAAGLAYSAGMGSKLLALQAGIVFSTVGMLWGGLPELWDASRKRAVAGTRPGAEATVGAAIRQGSVTLLKSSAITMIGPLLIIALLNNWKFFSGTDKYLLPKATQLIPLLLIALAFAGEVFPHRVIKTGADTARGRARARFDNIINQPFTIRVAGTIVLLFVVGSIWIARTGNDSGMEISGFELKMRATLEQIFITRPRTKEIFVGMPAMLFAAYFILRRNWLLALGAAIVATIGQADLLNTFCHIHTPLFYSVLRSIHGLWLGILVGAVALIVYAALVRQFGSKFIITRMPPRPSDDEPDDPNEPSLIGTPYIPGPR
jgi:hypothetical protein